jgi:uncharacterized membrane protein
VINVGEDERLLSKIGGGLLVGIGLMRGGPKGLILAGLGGALLYRGATGHCSLYHALGANTAEEERGPMDSVPAQTGVRVEEAVTVNRTPEELFRFWRDYSNLPKFMADVESVTGQGVHSHWVARGPLGRTLQWDAEIHNEIPGELIAWRSLDGGDLDTAGSVHFTAAPGGRGTVVRINQKFDPPGGKLGIAVAKLLGRDPAGQIRESLSRFKQLMEAGEIATTQGQPSGRA